MSLPPLPEPDVYGYDLPEPPLRKEDGLFSLDLLMAYGQQCADAERERCAQICALRAAAWWDHEGAALACADAIRSAKA